MSMSDLDKREVCVLHGWVGRRAFHEDRHDLCEAPPDTLADDEDDEEGVVPDDEDPIVALDTEGEADDPEEDEDEEESVRGSRGSARRRGIPPKKTLAVRRITQLELAAGRAELEAFGGNDPYDRPTTRADCRWCAVCQAVRDGEHDVLPPLACGHRLSQVIWRSRPCLFIACKHGLYLDVSETGSIILNFPHLEPGDMPAERSCSLDLAERRAMTLEEIAEVTNLTRERIRQVELKALIKRARPSALAMGLGPQDAALIGGRHQVGPGADLEETGVEGAVPSDIASLLGSGGDSE